MRNAGLSVLLVAALAIVSCGGGGGDDGDGPDEPVSIDVGEASATVEVGATFQFHYSVYNASDTSVIWKVNDITGGDATVGTISTGGLYTASAVIPASNPVTVKAVANADKTKSDTAPVTITAPSSLTISPTSVTVPAGGTQQFTASSGASWEVIGPAGTDAGTWGTIDASGLYHAPAAPPWTGQVTVKGTSLSDTTKAGTGTVTIIFSNATLSGRYVFRYRTAEKPDAGFTGRLWAVGSFEADGAGAITNGSADFVSFASGGNASINAAFTGTYTVGADGRAAAEFVLAMQGSPVLPMKWVVNTPASGRIVAFDDTGSGWGNIDRQDLSTLGAGFEGTYVFVYDGLVSPHRPLSAAGMFDVSGGIVGSGMIDINDNGTLTSGAAVSGTCSGIDPATGRGTWTITANSQTHDFVLYAMGAWGFVFGSLSADQGYLGTASIQDKSAAYSNGSLAGDLVFISTGYAKVSETEGTPAAAAGRATADGQGNLTAGVVDSIAGGSGSVNAPASGTYAISPNGRGTMALTVGGGTNTLVVYLFAASQAYYVSMMPGVTSTGLWLPQSAGGFNTASLRSSFALTLRETFVDAGNDVVGQMSLDGLGALEGTADANFGGVLAPAAALTGTYSLATNGRGEVALTLGQATASYAVYALSRRIVYLVPIGAGAPSAAGYAYRQY